MGKRFLWVILFIILFLSIMTFIVYNAGNSKLNVKTDNIKNIELSSLPKSGKYNKTISNKEDIDKIVKCLNSMNLHKDKGSADKYVGMCVKIKINFNDNSVKQYDCIANKFIKADDINYDVKYDEAERLDEVINNILNIKKQKSAVINC